VADKSLIVIAGPTAVGKTAVSIELAKRLSTIVINADSRQVFKEMSIGTAKPSEQEMGGVKHFFVDDRSIEEDFSAGIFEREVLDVLKKEFETKEVCILSGGSGLYIDSVCLGLNDFPHVDINIRNRLIERLAKEGVEVLFKELQRIDKPYAEEIEKNNSQRIVRALEIYEASGKRYSEFRVGMKTKRAFNIYYIGLELPRDVLYKKINDRMDQMIESGLFQEAVDLKKYRDKNALKTVGYNEVYLYQDGLIDKVEAIRILKRNSRRYAKRQLTWFKRNKEMKWFDPTELNTIYNYLSEKLNT